MPSPDIRNRAIRACQSTWNAIAADVETAHYEMASVFPDSSYYRHPMTDDVIAEMILDADRVKMYGDDDEAAAWLYSLPLKEMEAIAKEACC